MRVPYTNFKTRTGDDQAVGGCALIGGEWKDLDTTEIFDDKKVVVFALPGAFTPTCSSQQLPGYEEKYDELKAQGVDEVYCLSVNDAFVMNAWARDQKIEKVKMLPDGSGVFTQGMGMLVNKDHVGFGMRSWRYSMYVDNGEVVKVFEEPGKNNAGDNGDPFEVSDADTMIKYLEGINAG
jgi:peroxiredoxin